ncbi:FLYWCH-type zinc finger-containing protein 1 [Rhinophrynus dorsalis]
MNKNQVNEKILNLTLEIIFLLTGEDCTVVRKQRDHVADSSSSYETDPIAEPLPNSLIQERDDDQKCLELIIKIQDESSNRDTSERPPICPSQDCTEEDNGVTQDFEMELEAVIFPQECKEEEIPTDISTGGSSNKNIPEGCPTCPYSQECTEENRITRVDQTEPGAVVLPQKWKVEDISTEISTDESSNRNRQERCTGHPYSQDCTEENRTTQDYQVKSGDDILHQQYKEEDIPTDISTAHRQMPLEFIRSNKGAKLLVVDGCTFRQEKIINGKCIWKCTEYSSGRCGSRCHTKDGVICKEPSEHNHVPDIAKVEAKRIIGDIKEMAARTKYSTQELVAVTSETATAAVAAQLPALGNLKQAIRRVRRTAMAPTRKPTNLE